MSDLKCPGCRDPLPEGANFCPACGRALGAVERPAPAAGGGWTEFLDRAWDFFASTRVATVLIVILAIASITGSLIEQEHLYQDWRPPELYYPARYGEFWGPLFMKLGLTHAYSSLWYAFLVLLCVISLIICSLHRLVPLHRMLTRPQVWKLPHFIRRQEVVAEVEGTLDEMAEKLRRRGYKVIRDRECLYADKGRLSRYGPYIIHIGLIVVAFAAFAKAIPGWDVSKDVWIPDGETAVVPGTDFAIKNYKFTMELYPNGAPARFATDAAIVEGGQEVIRKEVEVNHPLSYEGWDIYQASFRQEPGVATVNVVDAASKKVIDTLVIDLRRPKAEYEIGQRSKLVVEGFYHDFTVDPATQQPTNASYEVKNPVLMGSFVDRETGAPFGRVALAFLSKGAPIYDGPFYLQVEKLETRSHTLLKLHKDRTIPYMFAGLAVVMLGMVITFFIFHWQVWVREENGKLLVGARAYKNKFGLKQEMRRLLELPHEEGSVA
jgi:cytochrome c biogenesis protein